MFCLWDAHGVCRRTESMLHGACVQEDPEVAAEKCAEWLEAHGATTVRNGGLLGQFRSPYTTLFDALLSFCAPRVLCEGKQRALTGDHVPSYHCMCGSCARLRMLHAHTCDLTCTWGERLLPAGVKCSGALLDCAASADRLVMPDKPSVAHGDANLAYDDFLKTFV